MFVPRLGPRYSKEEAQVAIASSRSWAEALRRLGMCHSGGAHLVLRKYAGIWNLSHDHFDAYAASRGTGFARARPLAEILVESSDFSRVQLKRRLYEAGLKQPVCELCGQDNEWRGHELGMILDHVNGVSNDNRLENLRIVCPNCAATLDTHCGRTGRRPRADQVCERCGQSFAPKRSVQRYCSPECGVRWNRNIPSVRRDAEGRPAAVHPAPTRDPCHRLRRHRASLRSVRQRGPQVDPGLRARAGAGRRGVLPESLEPVRKKSMLAAHHTSPSRQSQASVASGSNCPVLGVSRIITPPSSSGVGRRTPSAITAVGPRQRTHPRRR